VNRADFSRNDITKDERDEIHQRYIGEKVNLTNATDFLRELNVIDAFLDADEEPDVDPSSSGD
jgi:hypothetical protein